MIRHQIAILSYFENLEGDSCQLLSGNVLESSDHALDDRHTALGELFACCVLEGKDP